MPWQNEEWKKKHEEADDKSFHIILMANNKMKWKMVQTALHDGYNRAAKYTFFYS